MRFEAKHSYFKHIARVIGNFKNIPKTMALRHQHFMCYQLIGNTYLKPSPAYHGGNATTTTIIIQYHTVFAGKPVKVAAVSDYALHIKLAAMELSDDSVLQRYITVRTHL